MRKDGRGHTLFRYANPKTTGYVCCDQRPLGYRTDRNKNGDIFIQIWRNCYFIGTISILSPNIQNST